MKRTRLTLLACWAFLVFPTCVFTQATSPNKEIDTPQGRMVVFDGKEHPETIPAYVLWRESFQTLDLAKRKNSKAIPHVLVLSDADAALVYAEAHSQVDRLKKCADRQEREWFARAKAGEDWTTIYTASQAIDYDCRLEVLAARDRLLAALSPEGVIALTTWVDGNRKAITVMVPVSEVEAFKRPQ